MYKTNLITQLEEFSKLRQEWNHLLHNSEANTIFLTWEWLYTWWETFGKEGKLFIITLRSEQGELVGIAPLFIRKCSYYNFPVKEISFIGAGHSDRQDLIVLRKSHEALETIILEIYANKTMWDVVRLDQIPSESPFVAASSGVHFRSETENSSLCPYIMISDSWDPYFNSLSKNFRRDIKRTTNRICKFGKWEFKVERRPKDIEKMIATMENIEATGRKADTEKAFFLSKVNKNFLTRFCKICLENQSLDYSIITINDKPIAYLLGFLYNNKYYAYNNAFSEDFRRASPGKLLLNEKVRWCFDNIESVKEFDFLRGEAYIKSLWTSKSRQHVRIVFFNNSLYSRFIRYMVFSIRPKIKTYKKK